MIPYQGEKPFANGWFKPYEGIWYNEICRNIKNGKIIEIGSFEGLSLSYIKDTIKSNNNTIYCVEKYCRKKLIKNTKLWGVNLIRKDSILASKDFPDNYFDLVYIDADHSYEFVKKDIENWITKVKNKGIIAGHDYDKHWPDVMRAVNELLPKRIINGRNWLFKKRNYFKS